MRQRLTETQRRRLRNPQVKDPNARGADSFQRVENGVALLNKTVGPQWSVLIEPTTFNIFQGASCVLGQVFLDHPTQGFDIGLKALGDYVKAHNINGHVQDLLFERYAGDGLWLNSSTVAMSGNYGFQEIWLAVIEFLQTELVGSPEIARQARVRYAQEVQKKAAKTKAPKEKNRLVRLATGLRKGHSGRS